jgi:CRP-like cAMP-binding protein
LRQNKAARRLEQRIAARNGTVVVKIRQHAVVPLARRPSTGVDADKTNAANFMSPSLVLGMLKNHKVTTEVNAIQARSAKSRKQCIQKLEQRKNRADTNLQKRLALRQRAKQERALKNCIPFQKLSDASQDHIVDVMKAEKMKKGTALCQQGNVANSMFLLMAGHCTVIIGDLHVANLYPLDIFGEGAMTTAVATCTATVVAAEDIEVLVLSRFDLEELIESKVLDNHTKKALEKMAKERKMQNELLLHAKNTDALKNCKLFHSLSEQKRATIVDVMTVKIYHKGQVLCNQDDTADAMFLIMNGTCDVITNKVDKVNTLKELDVFGEGALFNHVRNATVQAVSDQVKVLMLLRKDLLVLKKSNILDKRCVAALKKMSKQRIDGNRQEEKIHWREHQRLQELDEEEEIIVVDDEE